MDKPSLGFDQPGLIDPDALEALRASFESTRWMRESPKRQNPTIQAGDTIEWTKVGSRFKVKAFELRGEGWTGKWMTLTEEGFDIPEKDIALVAHPQWLAFKEGIFSLLTVMVVIPLFLICIGLLLFTGPLWSRALWWLWLSLAIGR